ncbi:ribosome maturation factor RimM [Foetidibacter luteolus]|uniref:ribosome maturation factor RimM n=1 Tax=Foetidibacter luteolus TaxID=2608880 RepID=UPI00129ADFF3|nr:ribosome maturation factor RimM [Foetidibacter luteolus]
MSTSYINIGKIVASFGLKGEVIVQHALGKKTTLKAAEALFVEEIKGSYLPYFIEESKAKDETEIYVKLEGIDSKEAARKLNQKQVWLQEESFRKLAGKTAPIALIGFTMINEGNVLGKVEEVIEQPHQVLLMINYKGKEALIPLHGETLKKIDQQKKEVHVKLPDGLLDIYA